MVVAARCRVLLVLCGEVRGRIFHVEYLSEAALGAMQITGRLSICSLSERRGKLLFDTYSSSPRSLEPVHCRCLTRLSTPQPVGSAGLAPNVLVLFSTAICWSDLLGVGLFAFFVRLAVSAARL